MRISDWSSDVCSSDLPWLVKSMIGLDYERRRNSFPMGPMVCKDGYVGIPPLTPTHWEMLCQLMGIADISAEPDRKRGEQGKNGSVRLDRGGRRILKIKVPTTYTTRHTKTPHID